MTQDLIYTSKGNLPVADLTREVKWEFDIGSIAVVETYYLDGEIVKQGRDVFKVPEGTELYIKQGNL